MDSIDQKQKRFLLQQMAQNGVAAPPQPPPAQTQALAQGAGYPQDPGTAQSAAQNLASRSTAQSAYLSALEQALPLATAQTDAKIGAARAGYEHDFRMKEREWNREQDILKRQSLLAAAPERRRRLGMVEDDIDNIGGGQSPDAIRYHQTQMADARRRQAEIDAEETVARAELQAAGAGSDPQAALAPVNLPGYGTIRLRQQPSAQSSAAQAKLDAARAKREALQRDIAGIGGGGLTPEAIDYHAQQLESGTRRRAELGTDDVSRQKALEEILREAGGDPTLGYEMNSQAIQAMQGPSLKEQADAVKAQRIITGQDRTVGPRDTEQYDLGTQLASKFIRDAAAAKTPMTSGDLYNKLIAEGADPETALAVAKDHAPLLGV